MTNKTIGATWIMIAFGTLFLAVTVLWFKPIFDAALAGLAR